MQGCNQENGRLRRPPRAAVQGIERVVLIKVEQTEPFLKARFARYRYREKKARRSRLCSAPFLIDPKLISLSNPHAAQQLGQAVESVEDPVYLVYLLASLLGLSVEKEQAILEAMTMQDALRLMHVYLNMKFR